MKATPLPPHAGVSPWSRWMPPRRLLASEVPVTLLDTFEGRRLLIAYYFMWQTGKPAPEQCEARRHGHDACRWASPFAVASPEGRILGRPRRHPRLKGDRPARRHRRRSWVASAGKRALPTIAVLFRFAGPPSRWRSSFRNQALVPSGHSMAGPSSRCVLPWRYQILVPSGYSRAGPSSR